MTTWTLVEPGAPSTPESCDPAKNFLDGFYFPPAQLADATNEYRPIWPLLAAAGTDPTTILALAAATYALVDAPAATFPTPAAPAMFPPTAAALDILHAGVAMAGTARLALAQAFADLAVSGRGALGAFRTTPPSQATLTVTAAAWLAGVAEVSLDQCGQGAQRALSRAASVAAYFTAIVPDPATRRALGWIAVAAEVDPPRRPVNVSTLPFPQYDITVPVRAPSGVEVSVQTRYAVISNDPQATPDPVIPDGDAVLLFLHGDGSRLEEAAPLVAPLLAAGQRSGYTCTVIAVDLPSHGYSTMIDPMGAAFDGSPAWDDHAPDPPRRPSSYPILEFLESFVVAFVAALDAKLQVAGRMLGPMGGSLGGNLCLRLARRGDSWVKQSIAWSPASVWNSLADDEIKQAGPNHCSTLGHAPELAGTRRAFVFDVFDSSESIGPIPIVMPQGDYWYRADWQPCKTNILVADRWERRELYNRIYRQWHYRMDWEQLLFSYDDPDPGASAPRYTSFRSRLLLASGSLDNNSPTTQIYGSCLSIASHLGPTGASGRTLFALGTGHSIHDERPAFLASRIDAFCGETLGGSRQCLSVSGNPIVRFTGDVHTWRHALSFAATDVGKLVIELLLTIVTGGDDLRGGSGPNDNCDVGLQRAAGASITIPNVNAGTHWAIGSSHTVRLPLPDGTKAGDDLTQLTLQTRFQGGLGGDNWNVNGVTLTAILSR
jgi:hypothetical protein